MTISSEKSLSGPYLCNGVTKNFAYSFKVFDAAHLSVKLHDDSGASAAFAQGIDYTVTGVGNESGGEVVMTIAPAAGKQLTITRDVPFVQEVDLENQGAFYIEVIERAFDEAAIRDQQLKEELGRAVVIGENVDVSAKDDLVRDITKLAEQAADISELVAMKALLEAVRDNKANINTVAYRAADIATVAGISVDVAAVKGMAGRITTVSNMQGNIISVTNNSNNINNVAGNIGDVNTVAGMAGDITAVNNMQDNITVVAGSQGNINNVVSNIASINTVANMSSAVAEVAYKTADITTVANMDISQVAANATRAWQWATRDEGVIYNDGVHPSGYSAYHWAMKAAASAAAASSIAGGGFLPKTGGTVSGDISLTAGKNFKISIASGDSSDDNGLVFLSQDATKLSSGITNEPGGGIKFWIGYGENGGEIAHFNADGTANFGGGVYAGDAMLGTSGNIYGEEWENWHSSGWAKEAINARIEARALAIANARINALVNNMIDTKLNSFKASNPTFTNGIKVQGAIKATGNVEGYTSL